MGVSESVLETKVFGDSRQAKPTLGLIRNA
jgi:hypothetical protein